MDTVVEVGSPRVLKKSSRRMSVIITAIKMTMISEKTNISGLKMPLRATSINPLEKIAPAATPILATIIITRKLKALEPMAELRKFTASLLTPTIRSASAKTAKATSMNR